MPDNTTLQQQVGGDQIRTLDKTGTGAPKTEAVVLDLGGGDGRSEFISGFPLPTALADVPVDDDGIPQLSLSPATMDQLEILFRQLMAGVYPITQAEATANVPVVNQRYRPGSYLRYGADPTGVVDSSTAIANAAKCNSFCFDDYPGGGTYLFVNEAVITNGNVRISGSNRNIRPYAAAAPQGTIFKFASSAPAAAAMLHWTGEQESITVDGIGFLFASRNTGQMALRFATTLATNIYNCAFSDDGTGAGTTNLCAIRFDGATGVRDPYSGAVVIRDNYFNDMFVGINLVGVSTTVKIVNNEFSGNLLGPAGVITAFGAITGGSGYTNSTYNNIPLTGGSGFGALANITVSGGAVTACTLVYGGQGYLNTDSLSATQASLGGTGSGFSIPVSTVATGATSTQGTAIRLGAGCSQTEVVGNFAQGWAYAVDSTATYLQQVHNKWEKNPTACFRWRRGAGSISTGASGASFGAITGGSGYVNGTYINVPLTGGLGSGALANVVVSGGAVTSVDVVADGVGYSVNDSLSASNVNLGGAGSGFSVPVANIVSNTKIWNSCLGDTAFGTGVTPIYPKNNFDSCVVQGQIDNYWDALVVSVGQQLVVNSPGNATGEAIKLNGNSTIYSLRNGSGSNVFQMGTVNAWVGSGSITNAAFGVGGTLDIYPGNGVTSGINISTNGVVVPNGWLGYATGAGGTVTQATSRTTGVTLNKATGAITLFSAPGVTTATTFTVTNSEVAATDVIQLSQKSGTNLYELFVTAVAAGSFNITFFTTGGTATDAPVINFTVLKGVTA